MCAFSHGEDDMINRQQFYKSKQWESFRQIVIDNRTDEDGFVHCAICGKPILKKYDLILHHKIELDDINCNDANIALNEDNIECVHFKCHNQIHERFGYNKTSVNTYVKKHVYIVYGSPCSGKTTWVHENATANDLVVDMDSIWQMIGVNERYVKPAALKAVVFDIRDHLYDTIRYRRGKWHNAFIIVGGALKGDRERLMQRVGADGFVFIDTNEDECLKRLSNRIDMNEEQKEEWALYIQNYFRQFQSN